MLFSHGFLVILEAKDAFGIGPIVLFHISLLYFKTFAGQLVP